MKNLRRFYLDRILQFDQIDNGMNSISEINPQAIKEAKAFDQQASQTPKKPLYGIPVTLKEKYKYDQHDFECRELMPYARSSLRKMRK